MYRVLPDRFVAHAYPFLISHERHKLKPIVCTHKCAEMLLTADNKSYVIASGRVIVKKVFVALSRASINLMATAARAVDDAKTTTAAINHKLFALLCKAA